MYKMTKVNKIGTLMVVLLMILMQTSIIFAAEVGDVSNAPDSGWQRIDDDNSNIWFDSDFRKLSNTSFYNDGLHQSYGKQGAQVKFNFTGDRIRVISAMFPEYNDNVSIEIDGKKYVVDISSKDSRVPTIVYSATGLRNGEHSLVITQESPASYGMVIDAFDIAEGSEVKPFNEDIVSGYIVDFESDDTLVKIGDTIDINLVIDNISEIAAEDILIEYDSSLVSFEDFSEVEGIKLVHSEDNTGKLRLILASDGESNVITEKSILLNLEFKAKSEGSALIDIIHARVADGVNLEKDLTEDECGEITIVIEGNNDVNDSGEFSLLDLSIDARHLGKDPSSDELSIYNADIVENGAIDEADLNEICRLMLENSNYTPNTY